MDFSISLPIVLTVAAITTGVGAWIQYFNDRNNKLEAKQTEQRANSLAIENTRLLQEVAKTSQKSNAQLVEVTNKLLEAQNTIEVLRKEGLDNALGSDDTYITVGGPNHNLVTMHNPSSLPTYDVGLQIWDYTELEKCNIQKVKGEYFIDRECYNKLHRSEMHPVIYGNSYFATALTCAGDKPLKYRAYLVCRKSKYYTDLIYVPGAGSIARRYSLVDGKMSGLKFFNSNKMKVDWNKEFPYPPNLKYTQDL